MVVQNYNLVDDMMYMSFHHADGDETNVTVTLLDADG